MADDETIDEPDQPLQLQFYSFCPQHQVVANLMKVETRSGQKKWLCGRCSGWHEVQLASIWIDACPIDEIEPAKEDE